MPSIWGSGKCANLLNANPLRSVSYRMRWIVEIRWHNISAVGQLDLQIFDRNDVFESVIQKLKRLSSNTIASESNLATTTWRKSNRSALHPNELSARKAAASASFTREPLPRFNSPAPHFDSCFTATIIRHTRAQWSRQMSGRASVLNGKLDSMQQKKQTCVRTKRIHSRSVRNTRAIALLVCATNSRCVIASAWHLAVVFFLTKFLMVLVGRAKCTDRTMYS